MAEGKLYRTPDGFLDLTGQRVGGRYPGLVSGVVAPTVDISNLLGSRKVSVAQATDLLNTIGKQVQIQVPDNETWLLLYASVLVGPRTANGDRAWVSVTVTNLPGSDDPINAVAIGVHEGAAGIVATSTAESAFRLPIPVALPAGAIIEGEVIDRSGNNIPWAVKVGYYKLLGN